MGILLSVKDVSVYYKSYTRTVLALDRVSLDVEEGKVVGVVGESGCGKSTFGSAIMRILPHSTEVKGSILFKGKDLLKEDSEGMRKIRGAHISMIFQDPMTSLNPVMKVKDHFIETIHTHKGKIPEEESMEMIKEVMDAVGISLSRLNDYPFQFSGGMRQRMMIALSLVLHPELVIADEPTTSLDVIIQAQILNLLRDLQKRFGMTLILITHDLGVVAEMAHYIAVFYAGHVVEFAPIRELYKDPLHPYTKLLMKAIPNIDIDDREISFIPGYPPDLSSPPPGCRFHDRCPYATKKCREEAPPVFFVDGRKVKCWLYEGERIDG